MVPSLCQKLVSRSKSSPKPRVRRALLKLETLDDRILPSVNATLHGGTLKVVADTHHGTSEVKIIQSQGQVAVEDAGNVVGSFGVDQVQQIQVKYRELQHQHAQWDLDIPVSQGQMTLTGFAIGEADLSLDGGSLTAKVNATLPDDPNGTAVNLVGVVSTDGTFDLAGSAAVQVDSYPLDAHFDLTDQAMTVSTHLSIPNTVEADLRGSLDGQGRYDLSGDADITVASNPLHAHFELQNASLSVRASIPLDGNPVDLTGTVDAQGTYNLSGTGPLVVAGFSLSAAVTVNSAVTASATLPVSGAGNVNLSGTYAGGQLGDLTGSGTLTGGGFSLTVNATYHNGTLTFRSTVALNGLPPVNIAGAYAADLPLSLTGSASFTIGGVNVTPSFTFTGAGVTGTAGLSIPNVGPLSLTGTVDQQGNFSLAATPHVVIGGFGLDPTFRLTNTSLTVAATPNLPIVGTVNLSGTVDGQGNYSVTAALPNLTILFVNLTGVSATLTNNSLTFTGHASNLPLIGGVDFTGTITGDSYTFVAPLPGVNVLGFTLKNLTATLDGSGLSVAGSMDNIPLVGSAGFHGAITSTDFSLSATVPNVDLLGFIHFTSMSLTLNSSTLSLSAPTTLPLVGAVTFGGAINASGSFTVSATAPHFTVLGFIGIDNATVSLAFPNPTLTVAAHVNLLNIGTVDFNGGIGAGGTFSFDGSASLTVAGFTLGTARMHMGNMPGDPSDGIHIGPFTTPALPLVGPVTIDGSYAAGGRFSFQATLHPTPPIQIGPIPVDTVIFGLTNDSLTLGIGVGYDLSSFLHLGGTGVVTVFAPSAQHDLGDFDLVATVDATVVGFQAAGGRMELKDTKGQFSFTVDAQFNLLVATAQFHGEIDFNKGLVGFEGSADVGVAGFTLSGSNFLITNAQVQNNNGVWSFPHDAQGHLIPGTGIHVELHSHTDLKLQPVITAAVDFDGTLTKSGSSYTIDVKGSANLTIAGFNLANATLEIDNTHMTVTVHYAYPGIFSTDFGGTVDAHGNFDLHAHTTLGLAGFGATGDLHLTNSLLGVQTSVNVLVATLPVDGEIHADGTFRFEAHVPVKLAGFTVASGDVVLANTGLHVTADVDVVVATLHADGGVSSTGVFHFEADVGLGFAGHTVGQGHVVLTNAGLQVNTLQDIATALKNLGVKLADVAAALRSAGGLAAPDAAGILQNLKATPGDIAAALKGAYNTAAQDAAAVLKTLGVGASAIAGALKSAYNTTAQSTAAILKGLGNSLSDIAGALKTGYGAALADVANALEYGIAGTTLTNVANALWNGIGGIYRSDVAGALWTGIGGITLANVANAVEYGISGTTLANVAYALKYGISGTTLTNVANALWGGIGGIYRSDVAGALWTGISGIYRSDVAGALWNGISGTTLANVANAVMTGISGTTLANVAGALKYGIGNVTLTNVANALWGGIGGIYRSDVAGALWNGISGIYRSDVAGALWNGISGTTLANVANAVQYGISGTTLTNVAGALWGGISSLTLTNVANALWNGIGGIYRSDVAGALWNGIGGINLANVSNALWNGIGGINLANVANAVWNGISGLSVANVANGLWYGIGGINLGNVASALWNGIGGIDYTAVASAIWHGIGGISLTDVANALVSSFNISFAQAWAIVSGL